MRGDVVDGVRAVGREFDNLPKEIDVEVRQRSGGSGNIHGGPQGGQGVGGGGATPGFAGGTNGQFINFGDETMVRLHGRERVMTEEEQRRENRDSDGRSTSRADGRGVSGQTTTLVINMDGRTVARVVAPWLPGAVAEYGVRV